MSHHPFDPEAADIRLSFDQREVDRDRLDRLDRIHEMAAVGERPSYPSSWDGRSLTSTPIDREGEAT